MVECFSGLGKSEIQLRPEIPWYDPSVQGPLEASENVASTAWAMPLSTMVLQYTICSMDTCKLSVVA